jgi:hypothetical protein
MTTMATTVTDRLVIVAFGTTDPSDEEWTEFLKLVTRQGIERTVYLIVTAGGVPTSSQRRQIRERLDRRTVPVVVLSKSAWVRWRVKAFSWLHRKVKAFAPTELDSALAFLGIPTRRTELIAGELARLRRRLAAEAPLGRRTQDGSQ